MTIDLQTTVLIYVFINYICTIILGSTWFRSKDKFKGIELIFADFVMQSVGLTLASLQFILPKIFSVLAANILMYIGSILLLFGIAKFVSVKIRKDAYYFVSVIFTALYAYFTYFDPDPRMRLIIFTVLILPVFIHTVYIVFKKADLKHRKYAFNIGIVHILFAITHGTRALLGIHRDYKSNYYSFNSTEAALVLISSLLMILLAFAVMQMIHIKLLDQLDNYICKTEHLLDETKTLAITDNLTKLFNRRKVEDILLLAIDSYKNYSIPVSVLLVDIDFFKRFNDRYGHDIGDRVLVDVAKTLKENIRNTDTIGRWGGEEFLIVLHNADEKVALEVGMKLLDKVRKIDLRYCDSEEHISISIGCANIDHTKDMNQLIKQADTALYKAKNSGRDKLEY